VVASCLLALVAMPATAAAQDRTFVVEPNSGPPGTAIVVWGDGWQGHAPGFPIQANIDHGNGNWELLGTIGNATVDADNGDLCALGLQIPSSAPPGLLAISGLTGAGAGPSASFTVTGPGAPQPPFVGGGRAGCRL
jgi:hypothetical protein